MLRLWDVFQHRQRVRMVYGAEYNCRSLRLLAREQDGQGFGIGIRDDGETLLRRHRGRRQIFEHAARDIVAERPAGRFSQ